MVAAEAMVALEEEEQAAAAMAAGASGAGVMAEANDARDAAQPWCHPAEPECQSL